MFKVFVIVSTFCTTTWALHFENCGTSPFSTAYIWLNFDMYPLPIIFPDELHMRVNIRILRNLTSPVIDTELTKVDSLTGNMTQVPCIQGTYIGTCRNIDLCTMNNNIVSTDPPSFQEQIDAIVTTLLGGHKGCPILATRSTDKDVTIKLHPLSSSLHKILHGDYMLKLIVKENPASKDNIGCIRFNFSVASGPPTPPPTVTPSPTTTVGAPLDPDHIVG
ncbi:uncharacterized protein LOC123552283 [Mercenaria mercenaria]|uniref:uncharacterized protein LOC123552283 n=1 Tax=Mercenaria mercenaria TaxID=6596 RepID=UPI00234EBFF4|nr:uncharacterized protein LOC123552283 [Mercenaria mercenaria]